MSDPIQLDTAAEAVLRGLQPLFAPYGKVTPVTLNHPGIVAEFRPGNAKDTDLADVPKPALDWAFGVECGTNHGHTPICGLVFTHFSRLEAFYAENPSLCGTLVTGWQGAAVIWLRAAGRIPRNFAVDGVGWCSQGTMLVGCPTKPVETFVSLRGEIKAVDFSEIIWSEQQQASVDQSLLEQEVGPPFQVVARGRRVLNLAFWARYFTSFMCISYDSDRSLFTWGDPKAREPVLLTVDETTREFANLLQAAAPSFGTQFPQGEIRSARVRQLVERIKLLLTQHRASDEEVLENFLASEVVHAPGKSTTSQEFRAAFVTYCGRINRVTAPASWFYRRLGKKVRAQFGVSQRHDIDRCGKRVRGFCGLALRSEMTQETDATDSTDASDGAQNITSKPVSN